MKRLVQIKIIKVCKYQIFHDKSNSREILKSDKYKVENHVLFPRFDRQLSTTIRLPNGYPEVEPLSDARAEQGVGSHTRGE